MGSNCPDTTVWKEIAEGRLSPEESDAIWCHIETCETCRQIASGLLRSAAWELEPGELPRGSAERFQASVCDLLVSAAIEHRLEVQPIILRIREQLSCFLPSQPVLVGEGEKDARVLKQELPGFGTEDESVIVRLRRDPETSTLIAYVIANDLKLVRYCSLVLEPDGKEFLTDEDGVCALAGIDEAEIRRSSLRIRPPNVSLVPHDADLVLRASTVGQGLVHLVSVASGHRGEPTAKPLEADLILGTPKPDGSVQIQVRLSVGLLAYLGSRGPTTLALLASGVRLQRRMPAPSPQPFTMGEVALPLSRLELRIFVD